MPIPVIAVLSAAEHDGRAPMRAVNVAYLDAVAGAGAMPVMIPPAAPDALTAVLGRVDGVLLIGGVDISPTCYGAAPLPACGAPDPARDAAERVVLAAVRERGVPLLGVCRGLQMLNVAWGGTLWQDLPSQQPGLKHDWFPAQGHRDRTHRPHAVEVQAGSRLAGIVGAGPLAVNSIHHQGIRALAPGLRATALAPDGLPEGLEAAAPGGPFLIAVQWHPEELLADPRHAALFAALAAAAAAHRAGA